MSCNLKCSECGSCLVTDVHIGEDGPEGFCCNVNDHDGKRKIVKVKIGGKT